MFYNRSSTFSSSEYILITLTSLLGIAIKGASVAASLCLYTCHITDFTKLNITSLSNLQRHEIHTEFDEIWSASSITEIEGHTYSTITSSAYLHPTREGKLVTHRTYIFHVHVVNTFIASNMLAV